MGQSERVRAWKRGFGTPYGLTLGPTDKARCLNIRNRKK